MEHIDVIISTKPTWRDISLYYIMSSVVFISFYFIKKIVDKKRNYILSGFVSILIIIFGYIQLFVVGLNEHHDFISKFINLNSEEIKIGSMIFSVLYALVLPRKVR
ncbi:hypothetical protein [Photorhabdus sp. SF281]|uniref:hypothetical protein n=1 Tax=Photorhabdus sp. SF281 TaxID=3459527 RepID=UPI004044904B